MPIAVARIVEIDGNLAGKSELWPQLQGFLDLVVGNLGCFFDELFVQDPAVKTAGGDATRERQNEQCPDRAHGSALLGWGRGSREGTPKEGMGVYRQGRGQSSRSGRMPWSAAFVAALDLV
jgi:hypothetical protein